jgi:hypothetical protein
MANDKKEGAGWLPVWVLRQKLLAGETPGDPDSVRPEQATMAAGVGRITETAGDGKVVVEAHRVMIMVRAEKLGTFSIQLDPVDAQAFIGQVAAAGAEALKHPR